MAFDQSVFNSQIAAYIRACLDLQARHDHFGKAISDGDADTLTTAFTTVNTVMNGLALS